MQKDKLKRSEYYRNRYHELKVKGICTHCQKNPAELNRTKCLDCITKSKAYYQRYKERISGDAKDLYHWRKKNNFCSECGKNPPIDGFLICEQCKDKRKKRRHKDYQKASEQGICYKCKKPLDSKYKSLCKECYNKSREKVKRLQEYRKENHLCSYCGKQLLDDYKKSKCEDCLFNARLKYHQKKYGIDWIEMEYGNKDG